MSWLVDDRLVRPEHVLASRGPGFGYWGMLGVLVVWTLWAVASGLVLEGLLSLGGAPDTASRRLWAGGLGSIVAAYLVLRTGEKWARLPLPELLPLGSWGGLGLRVMVPLGVGLWGLSGALAYAASFLIAVPPWMEFLRVDYKEPTLAGAVDLIVAAPVAEELICRGLVLSALLQRYSSRHAVVASALGFALLHPTPWHFGSALTVGLGLGWLRVKSGSLWPCVLLHASHNAVALLALWAWPTYEPSVREAVLIGLALAGAGFTGLYLVQRRRES
jgi:membrane protease YdiL (CAAX protease family)